MYCFFTALHFQAMRMDTKYEATSIIVKTTLWKTVDIKYTSLFLKSYIVHPTHNPAKPLKIPLFKIPNTSLSQSNPFTSTENAPYIKIGTKYIM